LHAFHAKHFPGAPLPAQFFYGQSEAPEETYDEEDDGLGYYEDGTKRTLTDEQIALFRHTEIQTILRERRRQREAENEAKASAESPETQQNPPIPAFGVAEVVSEPGSPKVETPTDDVSVSTPSAATPASDGVQTGGIDKEKRYRRMTKEKQRAKNKRYKQSQKKRKAEEKKKGREGSVVSSKKDDKESGEASDEWDPWHQANGPDAQKAEAVELDY
jgi:hypothetical protein